jgi:DNA-binding protein H-NS
MLEKTPPEFDFTAMSVDELWNLRSRLQDELFQRITADISKLQTRLKRLSASAKAAKTKRLYPKVLAKYHHPVTGETWSGRGKTPHWLKGKNPEDYRIPQA